MSPADARTLQLAGEIRRDWDYVREQLAAAQSVDPNQGAAQSALVALSLDHAYQAFETLLLRVERALGLAVRSGEAWHAALLADAALELPGLRPAVYPAPVRREWDGLLRSRHFLRHAYGVALEADPLIANCDRLERAVAATDPFLNALIESLLA